MTELTWIAIACIAVAATLTLWFLIANPPLNRTTKVLLLLGIAVFPIGAALSTNVVGFETTTQRKFCGGCHVMLPYTDDSADLTSTTLAARHARNPMFGTHSCYKCHANYGMYATLLTKMGGMKHVYYYYLGGYRKMPIETFLAEIHISEPMQNNTCMQCHSTTTPYFLTVPDHKGALTEIRDEKVSCASAGCHGPAHPFSKKARE